MEVKAEVLAVCISEKKGTEKKEIGQAVLKPDWGIEGDAHAGKWHRQVSLLAFEKIDDFRKKGAEVDFGAFGENIEYIMKPLKHGLGILSGRESD